MARDLRMSRMLHVLIHLDRHVGRATSEQIAQMISTNAVVVRRMMAGLRERGIVSSEKGHGGGWQLACPLAEISLRDVYEAVGHPPLFNIGPQADPSPCLVEQAVDAERVVAVRGAPRRARVLGRRALRLRAARPARGAAAVLRPVALRPRPLPAAAPRARRALPAQGGGGAR